MAFISTNHKILMLNPSSGGSFTGVITNETLTGNGTSAFPLGVNESALSPSEAESYIQTNSGNLNEVSSVVQSNSADWNLISGISGAYVPLTANSCTIGYSNSAGTDALAQGSFNNAGAPQAFAQGNRNSAGGHCLAQGLENDANNDGFAQGEFNYAQEYAFAQGNSNSAETYGFAQGIRNSAHQDSLVQGNENSAYDGSFAQGKWNSACINSISQGTSNTAWNNSIAQGTSNSAVFYSFAQGLQNSAAIQGFAQGSVNSARYDSLVQGNRNSAYSQSFAQGHYNSAYDGSLAQGKWNSAYSHSFAQGSTNYADNNAMAQGGDNTAKYFSQALGFGLSIQGSRGSIDGTDYVSGGLAIGTYNQTSSNVAFVVGNGHSNGADVEPTRSDAFLIYPDGSVSAAGKISANGVELGAGGGEVNTFVYNNSATISDVDESYQTNSAYFLTAHQDISNKLDTTAFSTVSGDFLTAAPADMATTGDIADLAQSVSETYYPNTNPSSFVDSGWVTAQGYITGVNHDTTLSGDGTVGNPLCVMLSATNDANVNNIVVTTSLPATPDANTLYLIPET